MPEDDDLERQFAAHLANATDKFRKLAAADMEHHLKEMAQIGELRERVSSLKSAITDLPQGKS